MTIVKINLDKNLLVHILKAGAVSTGRLGADWIITVCVVVFPFMFFFQLCVCFCHLTSSSLLHLKRFNMFRQGVSSKIHWVSCVN